jgi:hypothetical protein
MGKKGIFSMVSTLFGLIPKKGYILVVNLDIVELMTKNLKRNVLKFLVTGYVDILDLKSIYLVSINEFVS